MMPTIFQDMTDSEIIDTLLRGRGLNENDPVLRAEFSEGFLGKLRDGDFATFLKCGIKYGPVFREMLHLRSEVKKEQGS